VEEVSNKCTFGDMVAREFDGGTLRSVTEENFPVLRNLSYQQVDLDEEAVREPHIHPNAAQLVVVLSGRARIGIVGPGNYRQLLELEPGDMAFTPQGYLHWIENIGQESLSMGLILSSERPETIELSEMLGGASRETLVTALSLPENLMERMPVTAVTIAPGGNAS
jgi:oxalate decarboxylase/phosphoglucose isomerase-like protein (cupin superfamily)